MPLLFNSDVINFSSQQTSIAGLQKIQKAVELLSMSQGAPKSMEEATKKRYRFWETQPVPEISKSIEQNHCGYRLFNPYQN